MTPQMKVTVLLDHRCVRLVKIIMWAKCYQSNIYLTFSWQQQLTHGHENQTWTGAFMRLALHGKRRECIRLSGCDASRRELFPLALSSRLWTAVTLFVVESKGQKHLPVWEKASQKANQIIPTGVTLIQWGTRPSPVIVWQRKKSCTSIYLFNTFLSYLSLS